jgi:hypothetical protein
MKKLSILCNLDKNSLYIGIRENGKIIHEPIEDSNYKYLGAIFNSIGKLNKDLPITVIFDFGDKNTPFAFLLLLLKIKVNTGINLNVYINDKDTYDFINEFINTDPMKTKEFFYKNSSDIDTNALNKDVKDPEDETDCEKNLKDKFKDLKEQLDKDLENIKRTDFLKDLDVSENEEITMQNLRIQRDLNIIENLAEDNFADLMENNFTEELKKLNLSLF